MLADLALGIGGLVKHGSIDGLLRFAIADAGVTPRGNRAFAEEFDDEFKLAISLRKIGKSTIKNPIILNFYMDFRRRERREIRETNL